MLQLQHGMAWSQSKSDGKLKGSVSLCASADSLRGRAWLLSGGFTVCKVICDSAQRLR